MWKDIPNYETLYSANEYGEIKSVKNNILLKQYVRSGYKTVYLYKNKNKKSFSTHRLIGLVFIPNPENKPEINHKDGNKLNNHVDNLEWCTSSENKKHAYKIGLRKPVIHKGNKKFGKDNVSSKPVLQYSIHGDFIQKHNSQSCAARYIGVDVSTIWKACNGVRKTGAGFIWKFDKKETNKEVNKGRRDCTR